MLSCDILKTISFSLGNVLFDQFNESRLGRAPGMRIQPQHINDSSRHPSCLNLIQVKYRPERSALPSYWFNHSTVLSFLTIFRDSWKRPEQSSVLSLAVAVLKKALSSRLLILNWWSQHLHVHFFFQINLPWWPCSCQNLHCSLPTKGMHGHFAGIFVWPCLVQLLCKNRWHWICFPFLT